MYRRKLTPKTGMRIDCQLRGLNYKELINSGIYIELIVNSGIQNYAKFDLKTHYPPPDTHEVWHYKDTNDNIIKRKMNQFNWNSTGKGIL